jgi:repressor LexA
VARGESIKRLRVAAGLTQDELGKVLGVSGQAVGQWEAGKPISGANILKLLDYFTIDAAELIAEEQATYTSGTRAPLYGRIAAGVPIAMNPVEDSMWVPPKVLRDHPRGFYLRIEDESMNRLYPNGSLVFVDPEVEVMSGQVAAITVNDCDATVKRVHFGRPNVILSPESYDPAYKDEIFDQSLIDAVTILPIGRVVWSTMPYENNRA